MLLENKNMNSKKALSFEDFCNNYCGYEIDEHGNALSCYNKNSKWDWYEIGGRWENMIKTKNSQKVNYARIKDIVFTK